MIAGTRFGGYAELVTVTADQVIPLPGSLSFEQGAAFPVNYGTAYAALVIMGGLREGDRVLIHAAAGGVGIAATQIAKRIGAEIFGTASPSKHDAIREQGVDHAIDYRSQDFADRGDADHRRHRPRRDHRRRSARRASARTTGSSGPGGRMIMYGLSEVQTGEKRDIPAVLKGLVRMPMATMPWWKSLPMMNENKGVFGLNMLKWWDDEGLDRVLEPLSEGLEGGDYVPVVAEAFAFDRAADAHRFIAERKNVGKVVLVP